MDQDGQDLTEQSPEDLPPELRLIFELLNGYLTYDPGLKAAIKAAREAGINFGFKFEMCYGFAETASIADPPMQNIALKDPKPLVDANGDVRFSAFDHKLMDGVVDLDRD